MHPHPPRQCPRELRRAKIADENNCRMGCQKARGARACRVDHEQGNKDTRVEIKAHYSPSSRMSLTSGPASISGIFRPTRFAGSHSMSASVIGRGAGRTGFNSTTGSPRRVMTIPSPFRARSISFDSWFLAWRRCECSSREDSHQIAIGRAALPLRSGTDGACPAQFSGSSASRRATGNRGRAGRGSGSRSGPSRGRSR